VPERFHLERFVEAQSAVYSHALDELRRGLKTGHWMWFIFPQLKGLGHSSNAAYYGIDGSAEARAYLAHSTLAPRLIECTAAVHDLTGRSLQEIFGSIDAVKFRSSMTLFNAVSSNPNPFSAALAKYCGGTADSLTLQMLGDR
jgi:uncharacterized protein (DUF1810 family)